MRYDWHSCVRYSLQVEMAEERALPMGAPHARSPDRSHDSAPKSRHHGDGGHRRAEGGASVAPGAAGAAEAAAVPRSKGRDIETGQGLLKGRPKKGERVNFWGTVPKEGVMTLKDVKHSLLAGCTTQGASQ